MATPRKNPHPRPKNRVPPELLALLGRRRVLKKELGALDEAYAVKSLALINANLPEEVASYVLEQGGTLPFGRYALVMPRIHECEKSPTGHCVYHPETDPGDCDSCLFCHEPEERK